MKLLLIHSDYIEYEVKDKAIPNPEEIKLRKDRLEEALTAFIAVEKNDERSSRQAVLDATGEIEKTAEQLRATRASGSKIVAVGSTSVRVLEAASCNQELTAQQGWTDIFIRPGHEFRATDMMLTNFHLPRSTLLVLVCAFASRELIFEAYQQAIARKYRFYSYGDAMLIA